MIMYIWNDTVGKRSKLKDDQLPNRQRNNFKKSLLYMTESRHIRKHLTVWNVKR